MSDDDVTRRQAHESGEHPQPERAPREFALWDP